MNWRQFITEILHFAAWPASVLVVIYWLRKPIIDAIKNRDVEVQHKGTILKLRTQELKKAVSDDMGFGDVGPETTDLWDRYLDALEWIAVQSGLSVLANHKRHQQLAYIYYGVFQRRTQEIQKYRQEFNSSLLNSLKPEVDALGLD